MERKHHTKLQALLEQLSKTLPANFYPDLMSASRKSGADPAEVLTDAIKLYKATLLRPDSLEQLRIYAVQYHALVSKAASDRLTPEERTERARLGGLALSEAWTDEQKESRASLGGHAAAAKMTPEQRRQRALLAVEGRRRKRLEREQGLASSDSKEPKKRNRS